MDNKKHNITSKQMMTFIISSEVGVGIITLPSTLANSVGHDGWISVLLTGIVYTFVVYIFILFMNRYSDKSILQINIYLYGRFIGLILNIILLAYCCFTASVAFRLFIEIIKITVLKFTPPLAISALVSLTTMYLVFSGLKVLTRFSSTLYIPYVTALIFYIVVFRYARLTFIMPIGLAGIPLILKGMLLSGFSFLGFELVTLIYPYVTDKNNAAKYAVFANLFTTFLFTTLVFILTALAGEEKLKLSNFPLFHVATSIRIPIFERADLFFIILWFPVMASSIRAYHFSAYHMIDIVFKVGDKKISIVIFTIFIGILGRIPKDLLQIDQLANIIGIWGIGIISYLIVSFLFSFINKRGVVIK